jgi:predicted esterase
MHRIALTATLILQVIFLHAQDGKRYLDDVFNVVNKTRNIYYGTKDSQVVGRRYLDLYSPESDTATKRPVIILMHGGGFKFGSKNNSRMKIWGKHFAKRGYVVAAINYRKRKGNPLQRFPDLARSCMVAAEDALLAARYLRQHAGRLGIDTERVVLAGHSAGGMTALQAVYSSSEEVNQMLSPQTSFTRPSGHNPGKIAAIVNFWGAIFDTTWIMNTSVPIISVHGSRDRIVPYNFKDNHLYGSAAIHRTAQRSGIPSKLKTYNGFGHELHKHFNPLYSGPFARKRWREAGTFASNQLYEILALR